MKPRQKRLAIVGGIAAAVAIAAALVLNAFQSNLVFFYSPSQVAAHEAPQARTFRIGGMVEKGSLKRLPDGISITFAVTDNAASVPVRFKGIVPALFREGSGVVADGRFEPGGQFVAETILAKHDERYMPPEIAGAMHKSESLKK